MARSRTRTATRTTGKSGRSLLSLKNTVIALVVLVCLGGAISGTHSEQEAPVPDDASSDAIVEVGVLEEILPDDALAEDADEAVLTPSSPFANVGAAARSGGSSGLVSTATDTPASPSAPAAAPSTRTETDVPAAEPAVVSRDTSQLGDLIVAAWNVDGSAYTAESYGSMRAVLDAVGLVYNDEGATQAQLDQATADLQGAMGALVGAEPIPASIPEAPVEEVSVGRTVYITNTGAKYHTGSCRHVKKSKIEISLDDAIARGYTACSVCGG